MSLSLSKLRARSATRLSPAEMLHHRCVHLEHHLNSNTYGYLINVPTGLLVDILDGDNRCMTGTCLPVDISQFLTMH
jgi:hypothetical protein